MNKAYTKEIRVLVTGASGFIGQHLCKALRSKDYPVRGAVRTEAQAELLEALDVEPRRAGSMSEKSQWNEALHGVSTIVHLAARTHQCTKTPYDYLDEYRRTNVDFTAGLAQAAATSGVSRFVFLSSIKVNGERTDNRPFTAIDPPHPEDAYGLSKREAEDELARIGREYSMETVILRPPLVYGPAVRGNILKLLRLLLRKAPLPLKSVSNLRSLIYVGNLVDAIVKCIDAPEAAGKTYLVSDGEDVSTPDLIRRLAAHMNVPSRLFPCPVPLLKLGATVLGKRSEIARLTGSLQVDSSAIRQELGWMPPFSLEQGLAETVRWFKERNG